MRFLTIALCHIVSPLAAGEKFQFVTLGDTAYNQDTDLPVYERPIQVINETRFTIFSFSPLYDQG